MVRATAGSVVLSAKRRPSFGTGRETQTDALPVAGAFADDVDYAMLVRLYGEDPTPGPERKYSPANASARGKRSTSATLICATSRLRMSSGRT
jgi:hypothetical protein